MNEDDLIERLRKVERLFAGATTEGEKQASANARERITKRLNKLRVEQKNVEFKFSLADAWSRKLFLALLRRYDLKPYRRARQRYTTVMVKAPESFINETLWPEYLELSEILQAYLTQVTEKIISESIFADSSDAPELPTKLIE